MRLRLTLAYDGGAFAGWQSQATHDTAQDALEAAFLRICGRPMAVHAAGRTDAGVHALGQSAHVDVPDSPRTVHDWLQALNGNLPAALRVLRVQRAGQNFHARFSATGKIYRYQIWNDAVLDPLEIGRVWHVPSKLDLEALRRELAHFIGRHDFGAFAANRGAPPGDTVRLIRRADVRRRGSLIRIEFEGDGFLYRMARMMSAAAVRAAQGRHEPGWIPDLLRGKSGTKCTHVAPACGLYLVRVLYSRGKTHTTGDANA